MKQKEHACRLCEEKWHAFEEQDVCEELQSGVEAAYHSAQTALPGSTPLDKG